MEGPWQLEEHRGQRSGWEACWGPVSGPGHEFSIMAVCFSPATFTCLDRVQIRQRIRYNLGILKLRINNIHLPLLCSEPTGRQSQNYLF